MSDISRLSANIHKDFKPHFRSDLPEGSEESGQIWGFWYLVMFISQIR